ncbi:MAG: hypothetical protein HOO91_21320 [Bacteroidales bacterium]|nr:hypothetical protein [Bacteroidales bacterium]
MEAKSGIELLINAMAGILVPISIAFVGYWFTRQKEKSDEQKNAIDTFSTYLDALSSDNQQKQKYALIALHYLKLNKKIPKELMDIVDVFASNTNLEVASAAMLVDMAKDIDKEDLSLLQELLLPVKIHLDRTKNAFRIWISTKDQKPNEKIEEMIYRSNVFIRDLLIEKWYLIPVPLQEDALKLIDHFNDWTEVYFKLRPEGKRIDDPKYVFSENFGFPQEAERNFIAYYEKIINNSTEHSNCAS